MAFEGLKALEIVLTLNERQVISKVAWSGFTLRLGDWSSCEFCVSEFYIKHGLKLKSLILAQIERWRHA